MSQSLSIYDPLIPGVDLEAYKRAVHGIPMLSEEEESALAKQLYYHADVHAARRLILAHLRFVIHIAKTYSGYGLSQADLIQEGNVGLMKAVRRFNPEIGVRLVSFAIHWIRAEIHEFILKNWRIVKIATTKAQRKLFFNLRKSKTRLGWFNEAEIQSLAKTLAVDPGVVRQMEGRMAAHDTSVDLPTSDEANSTGVWDESILADARHNPAHEFEAAQAEQRSQAALQQALTALDGRSRDIISQRWLNEHKSTLYDLAEQYQVSPERIRQIEKNALTKLKGLLSSA